MSCKIDCQRFEEGNLQKKSVFFSKVCFWRSTVWFWRSRFNQFFKFQSKFEFFKSKFVKILVSWRRNSSKCWISRQNFGFQVEIYQKFVFLSQNLSKFWFLNVEICPSFEFHVKIWVFRSKFIKILVS